MSGAPPAETVAAPSTCAADSGPEAELRGASATRAPAVKPSVIVSCAANALLTGAVPEPLLAAARRLHYPVPRGAEYHYSGCGCGVRPWCGSFVDWIWAWKPGLTFLAPLRSLPGYTHGKPTAFVGTDAGEVETMVAAAAQRVCGWHKPDVAGLQLPSFDAPISPRFRLRVSYLIPHHNVTGGMKMIMKQIELLHARGHWVQAVFRSADASVHALPPWARDVAVDDTLVLSPHQSVVECFKYSDVIVIG